MPPLTWRDTVSPDFSTSLAALRQAGGAMNAGLGGIGEALGKFNEYAQGQNASVLMANASKYTNPADLQAAFASGHINDGVNPGYLTADAIKSAQGQVGTLLNNAANTETNKFNALADPSRLNILRDNDTVLAGNQAARIAHPFLENAQTAATTAHTGAETAGLNIANTQSTAINPMLLDQQGGLNRTRNIGNDMGQLGLTGAQRTDVDTQAAVPFINQLSTVQDADGVNRILASATSLSPGARAHLIAAAQALPYSGMAGSNGSGGTAASSIAGAVRASQGPASGGGSSTVYDPVPASPVPVPSAAGTAGTQNGSMYDASFGNKPTASALSTQKLGDVVDYGNKTMIPQTGHSPTGAYQITADTLSDFGPRVFGADWKNTVYSPANQDKLGEAIFEASKNGNLKARWDSLPDATPGAYANKTWAQMRSLITQGEVGRVDTGGQGGASAAIANAAVSPVTRINPGDDLNTQLQKLKTLDTRYGIETASTNRGLTTGDAQQRAKMQEASIYSPTMQPDYDKDGKIIGQHPVQAAIEDTVTPSGTVAEMMSANGPYKGVAAPRLDKKIQEVMQDAGVSAMAAKTIIEAHSKSADAISRNLPYWAFGYNSVPDDTATHNAALAIRKGTGDQTAINSASSAVTQSKIADAGQEAQKASQALARALRTPTMADQVAGYRQKLDDADRYFHDLQKPAYASVSANPVWKNEDGTIIDRHQNSAIPAAAPAIAAAAGQAPTSAPPTAPVAPTIPGENIPDPDVQASRGKVQAALDRLTAAQTRNDPKLPAYRQTYNRVNQALLSSLASRSASAQDRRWD